MVYKTIPDLVQVPDPEIDMVYIKDSHCKEMCYLLLLTMIIIIIIIEDYILSIFNKITKEQFNAIKGASSKLV